MQKLTKMEEILALPFVEIHKLLELPKLSGIYFVLDKSCNQLLYVGSSQNIAKRWKAHHVLPKLLEYQHEQKSNDLVIYYWEADFADRAKLKQKEKTYIHLFYPLLNVAIGELDSKRKEKKLQRLNSFEILDGFLDKQYAYKFSFLGDDYKSVLLNGKDFSLPKLKQQLEKNWSVRITQDDLSFAIFMFVRTKDRTKRFAKNYGVFRETYKDLVKWY